MTLIDVEETSKQDREMGFWRKKQIKFVSCVSVGMCKRKKDGGGAALKSYVEIRFFLNFSFLFEE